MAATKKTIPPVAKAEETIKKAVKKVPETVEVVKKEVEKKEPVKKAEAATKAIVKKAEEKKDAVKKAATKKAATKKEAVKAELCVQFAGKSYTQEELVKMAKDVWKYDLKKKVGDFKSVELYVKPEENQVYYVINKEVTGSFYI